MSGKGKEYRNFKNIMTMKKSKISIPLRVWAMDCLCRNRGGISLEFANKLTSMQTKNYKLFAAKKDSEIFTNLN